MTFYRVTSYDGNFGNICDAGDVEDSMMVTMLEGVPYLVPDDMVANLLDGESTRKGAVAYRIINLSHKSGDVQAVPVKNLKTLERLVQIQRAEDAEDAEDPDDIKTFKERVIGRLNT